MEALRALTAKRLARTRVNSDQYSAKLSLFEVSLDIEERVMKITWYDSTQEYHPGLKTHCPLRQ